MVIQEIGIIGSGTMGGGIAQLAAQNGFNPAFIMKLVEVVRGLRTSQETIDEILSLESIDTIMKLGKKNGEGFYDYRK